MGDVMGDIGGIISSKNSEGAIQQATDWQTKAIQNAADNVTQNMNPAQVNQVAQQQAASTANASLNLQKQIDPSLVASRYASEGNIATSMQDIMNPQSQAGQVQTAATQNALTMPNTNQSAQDLIDAAHKELQQGATLPADLQAEMMQSGLQVGGQSMGRATGTGAGGTILSTVLGSAGTNLEFQRKQQAASLLTSAANLNTSRQNILSNLFPSLKASQLSNLGAAGSVFGLSNNAMPTSGISGTDAANVWLNRIGAQNSLNIQKSQVAATGKLGTTQAQNEQTAGYISAASDTVKDAAKIAMML